MGSSLNNGQGESGEQGGGSDGGGALPAILTIRCLVAFPKDHPGVRRAGWYGAS